MTTQEVFDKVARHLLTQNAQARYVDPEGDRVCAYRGENDTKCAVGCLIPDELYQAAFEGKRWFHPPLKAALQHAGVEVEDQPFGKPYPPVHMLLNMAQGMHDANGPSTWPERLREIAKELNLNSEVVDEMVQEVGSR